MRISLTGIAPQLGNSQISEAEVVQPYWIC
jgi:hypothetical protein